MSKNNFAKSKKGFQKSDIVAREGFKLETTCGF